MRINSLNALLRDPTFRILVKTQAIQDDQDPVLMQSQMTRSPYQLLALLLLWEITTEKSKAEVVKQINKICSQQGLASSAFITVTKLNELNRKVDWQKIATDLDNSSGQFCTLLLPKQVIENLKKTKSISPEFLAKIVKEELLDKCTIITTIDQRLEWVEPFYSRRDSWVIPKETFTLSPGLIQACQKIKTKEEVVSSIPIGAFKISAKKMIMESHDPVPDTYAVTIKKGNSDKLIAELKEQTPINTGLYAAFKNATLRGEFPVVAIDVVLDGKAFLDANGVGVEQTQYVQMSGCCGPSFEVKPKQEYFHFDIEVMDVHVLFDSKIAVNFSESKRAVSSSEQFNIQDIFISLNGYLVKAEKRDEFESRLKDRRSIKIYPESLSHQAVIDIFYKEQAMTHTFSANPARLHGKRKVVEMESAPIVPHVGSGCTLL